MCTNWVKVAERCYLNLSVRFRYVRENTFYNVLRPTVRVSYSPCQLVNFPYKAVLWNRTLLRLN